MHKLDSTITQRVLARCDELAAISELTDGVLRQYLTPEHQRANQLVARYLAEEGLHSWQDAVGNQWGRLACEDPSAPRLVLGSHLDTVPYAGKYDGILGVLMAIEMLSYFAKQPPLPFHLDVVGFADEEGTRFGTTLIGSKAIANAFDGAWLQLRDKNLVTFADAMTDFGLSTHAAEQAAIAPETLLGYWEVHIEQGPVLEALNQPLGVVTGIAGAKRAKITLDGMAGHAGTTPMNLRRDAVAGAAELIHFIEQEALLCMDGEVATVGNVQVKPGAANVIAGQCTLTLDVRALNDAQRDSLITRIEQQAQSIAAQRQLSIDFHWYHQAPAVLCADAFQQNFHQAAKLSGLEAPALASGAGHDAMAVAAIAPVGMLFIRSPGGISHHPSESVIDDDVHKAMNVFANAIAMFAASRMATSV